jgi:dipicolinate synthase subunit A
MTIVVVENGDIRMQVAGRKLAELGYDILAVKPDAIPPTGECLLLPIPSRQYLDGDFSAYPIIAGAALPAQFVSHYTNGGCRVIDLIAHPAFVEENARLTAEAAIALGMEVTGRSYLAREVDIIGFGRIAKALARYLLALGAYVRVYARREEAREEARQMGASPLPLEALSNLRSPFLFNTVPAPLLNASITADWTGGVVVELASGENMHLPAPVRLVDGKSLPGRRLPVSAGELLAHTLTSILTAKDSTL